MADFKIQIVEAIDLSDSGKYKKALTQFNKLVKAFPDQPQAYFERAMVYLNLDRDDKAIVDLEKALSLDSEFPGARDWLARAAAGQGKSLYAAETKFKEITSLDNPVNDWSVSPQSWADCAEYYIEADQFSKAREVLERYLTEYESQVVAYVMYSTAPLRIYCLCLINDREYEKALEYAEKCASHEHNCPADQFMLVRALAFAGQMEKAKEEFGVLEAEYEGTLPYEETKRIIESL